jgi:hypothetical protein
VSLSGALNSRLVPIRSPWFTRHDLPRIPSPTTQHALSSLYRCPSSATDAHVQHSMGQASPCMRRLAAPQGRIVFVILRTACSPPVALHPASQQRSYLRLPKSGIISEEDFHLLNRACSQAHSFRRKPDQVRDGRRYPELLESAGFRVKHGMTKQGKLRLLTKASTLVRTVLPCILYSNAFS